MLQYVKKMMYQYQPNNLQTWYSELQSEVNWSCSTYFWEQGISIEETNAGRRPAGLLARRVLHDSSWEFLLRADRTHYTEYKVSLNIHFNLKEDPLTWGCIGLHCLFTVSLPSGEGLAITKLSVTSVIFCQCNFSKATVAFNFEKENEKKVVSAAFAASDLMLISTFFMIISFPL